MQCIVYLYLLLFSKNVIKFINMFTTPNFDITAGSKTPFTAGFWTGSGIPAVMWDWYHCWFLWTDSDVIFRKSKKQAEKIKNNFFLILGEVPLDRHTVACHKSQVVTPSMLHPKLFIKTCHGHHVYVLMHVIECVDKFLVT